MRLVAIFFSKGDHLLELGAQIDSQRALKQILFQFLDI
jgi:hypothetical protein